MIYVMIGLLALIVGYEMGKTVATKRMTRAIERYRQESIERFKGK